MPLPSPKLKLAALALAALVATTLTTQIALLATIAYDDLIGPGAGPDYFGAISFTDFLGGVFGFLIVLPFFAALFGFPAAFVFLGASLGFLGPNGGRAKFVLAGALTGLVHSSSGFALRMSDYDAADANGWDAPLDWILWLGGFALTSLRPAIAIPTFPASVAAGAIAGLVYARLIGVPPALKRTIGSDCS